VRKAKSVRGTRFLHILSPCPPGWKYSDEKTIEMGRMAVQNRVFPLLEIEDGMRWRFTVDSAGDPVEPYIRAQGRFRHLDDAAIARIQEDVDARWDYLSRMVASSG
jgi:pyruvate/2-oxoacid:ferredoxin oxidoreductase beta subunit